MTGTLCFYFVLKIQFYLSFPHPRILLFSQLCVSPEASKCYKLQINAQWILLGRVLPPLCLGGAQWTTSIPVFLSLRPFTAPPPCVSWPWTGTRSCCPSSASVTSKAWLWRAQALALPPAALSPRPPPPAVPALLSSTLPMPWSRYHQRNDLNLQNCIHTHPYISSDTLCPRCFGGFFCLQEKSLPGVVMALVCNVFEMLYQLANLDESRWEVTYTKERTVYLSVVNVIIH